MSTRANEGARAQDFMANASANAGAASLVTAGGTGDGVKITGETIDLLDYMSGKIVVAGLASLADTETLTVATELQESADDVTWDTAEVVHAAEIVATGTTGGTNEPFSAGYNITIEGRKRYARFNVTPDLSATATDTALFVGVFMGMGKRQVLV